MGYVFDGKKKGGGYVFGGDKTTDDSLSRTQSEITNAQQRIEAVGGKQPKRGFQLLPALLEGLRRTDYATTNLIKEFIPSQRGEKFDPLAAIGRGLTGKERTELKDVLAKAGVSTKPIFDVDIMPGKKEVRVAPSLAGVAGFVGEAFNPLNPINWVTFGTGGAITAGAKGIAKAAAKEAGKEAIKRIPKYGVTAKLANPITGKVAAEGLIPGTAKAGEAFAGTVGKRIVESEPYQKLAKSFSTKFIPESVPDKVIAKTLRGGYEGESLDTILRSGSKIQPAGKALGETDFKELPGDFAIIGRLVSPTDRNNLGKITAFNPETQEVTVHFFNKKLGTQANRTFSPKQLKVLDVRPEDLRLSEAGDILNPTIKDVSGKEAFADIRTAREAMEQMARGEVDKVDKELQAAFKGLSLEERKMITKAVGLRSTDELPEKLAPYYKSAVDTLEGYRKWLRGAGILPREIEKYVPFILTGKKLSKEQKQALTERFGTGINQFEGLDDLQEWYAQFMPNIQERTTQSTIPSEVNEFLKKNFFEEDIAEILSTYTSRAIKAQGAKEFFDAVVAKYGLKLEDAKSIKDVPQGYGLYRLKIDPETGQRSFEDVSLQAARSIDKQVGKQTKLADAANVPGEIKIADDILALPAEFAKHINEYTGAFFDPTVQGTLWDYFDKATSIFKTTAYLWNPGHLPRDATSNMFQLWLMGMKDLRRYSDGIKILKGDKFTPRGLQLTSEQIMKNARDYGLIGTEMVTADMGKNFLSRLAYTQSMVKATRAVDDASRLAGFVDQLAKGLDPEQAAFQVKKYLFDYFELTPFERKWMKRVMPFYTWTRKNLPTQFRELLQQPRKYAQVARAQDYISEDFDQGDVPDWLRESAPMLLPGTKGQRQFTIPNLPYADLALTGKDIVAGANPLLRLPFELASGYKTFSGAPIDGKIGYSAGQLVPMLERIRTILDKENPRRAARVLSTLGSPTMYDEEQAKTSAAYEERNRLRKAIEQLKEEGKEVPTITELRKNKKNGKRGGYVF